MKPFDIYNSSSPLLDRAQEDDPREKLEKEIASLTKAMENIRKLSGFTITSPWTDMNQYNELHARHRELESTRREKRQALEALEKLDAERHYTPPAPRY